MGKTREQYQEEAEALLVGRRIVEARIVSTPSGYGGSHDNCRCAELVLDNGTVLFLDGNEGCPACEEGWFSVSKLVTCENIITGVRAEIDDDDGWGFQRFRIFVLTANEEICAWEVAGSDNGYYGTGYYLTVKSEGVS